ncbi:glutamate receptor ionotropic, delta-1 [Trichonephila inaurata madagascariensis]|uniref:Glutamate receptor ionotropic, delta-1 n=1 Tax=Trichonephila inaurata madagascariensis TaxID=2747483 RepID=A0A8X6XCQ9_9ARAC|nr:glutamate receptor ionotropic, delta-1 [Trichonephila inaurata madagascariensis]
MIPEDKQWGRESENGTWSGLIGLVSSGKADAALCFIGALDERKKVVDFTEPYTSNDLTFALIFRKCSSQHMLHDPFENRNMVGILTVFLLMPFMFRLLGAAKSSYSI